jgi:uncharacterized protein (DUF1684 family)
MSGDLDLDPELAPGAAATELDLAGWRRAVAELYAAVRSEPDPARGHAIWRQGRDELFRTHPVSPLPPGDPLRDRGLPYWPYDPSARFEAPLVGPADEQRLTIETSSDGRISLRLIGRVRITELGIDLDVWWLDQYAGGMFLPVRDGTAGTETYGGGRYLLDTAKGSDLGGTGDRLILDFNFLYHPSCRYSPAWSCPLAPPGDTTKVPIPAGERMHG